MFNFLRKKEQEVKKAESLNQKANKKNIESRYRNRINNLKDEFEILSRQLKDLELGIEITKSEKDKQSERLIRRMTLLKHEIEIREGLIRWL